MNDRPALAQLDLNLLRVFDVVYREHNLTVAARALKLTQPAVSNALARLRSHLGDPLFVRDGRRMAPTPRARELAQPVAQALQLLRAALGEKDQAFEADTSERRFVVGMREVVEAMLLAPMVREIARAAPRATVSSVRFERHLLPRVLASRTVDLAIDVRMPSVPGLMREPFATEELCVAMRVGHALSHRPLSLEDWLAASHVAVSARREGLAFEDMLLARDGSARRIAVRCQHYHAACAVVAESEHLLALPRRYAERMGRLLPLVVCAPPLPLRGLELCVYWHATAEHDPGLAFLLSLLRGARTRREGTDAVSPL